MFWYRYHRTPCGLPTQKCVAFLREFGPSNTLVTSSVIFSPADNNPCISPTELSQSALDSEMCLKSDPEPSELKRSTSHPPFSTRLSKGLTFEYGEDSPALGRTACAAGPNDAKSGVVTETGVW